MTKKLSIGFVIDDSLDRTDGVQQYVKSLGAWLSSRGHRVSYLSGQTTMTSWKGGQVYSLARNIRVKFNANRLAIPAPADKSEIIKILDAEQYDVLHIQ